MSSFLKKFQLLKKKDQKSNEHIPQTNRRKPESNFQPSTSQDPATQRTTKLLPLLVKTPPSSGSMEGRKKAPSQPVGLPELGQRPGGSKMSSAAYRADDKRRVRSPADNAKEQISFPKLLEKSKRSNTPLEKKKMAATTSMPVYPELADEQFRFLWDSRRLPKGKSVREALEMMDEREILDTILLYLYHSLQRPSGMDPRQMRKKTAAASMEFCMANQRTSELSKMPKAAPHNKIPVYKYFGLKLRDSRHKDVVCEYLHMLLGFSVQDDIDREGTSEAIGVVAFCHLSEILAVLREYGHMVPSRRTLHPEVVPQKQTGTFHRPQNVSQMSAQHVEGKMFLTGPKVDSTFHPSKETKLAFERQMRATLILCYGQAALGAKPEEMLMLVELIVSEVLYHFHSVNKDERIKKTFLRSVIMISKALVQSKKEDIRFPHKSELAICIIEIIEEEPTGSISVYILHQAMVTVTCMTTLKPPLDSAVRSELLSNSVKRVFALPALKVTKLKAGNPLHPIQTQDYYQQTIIACHNMLTGLLSEVPNLDLLQDILIHTNRWVESQKTYERERAIKSTNHLLKFASEHLDFDTSMEFSLLGQLVALLALHTADNVKEIGQVAAEGLYHLYYIIMSKMAKELEKRRRNKKGNVVKWYREDFFIPGPSIFYNNISKVAKAYGEHLTTQQLTDLLLKAIDSLTNEDKAISQAAGILLSSFLEECGMDLEDLPIIVKEIYNHLPIINDPITKEEALRALCSLSNRRLNGVVEVLLECSVECDDTVAEMWRALVADQYTNIKIMRPLLKRLQDEDPLSEVNYRRNSKSVMPLAATSALCFILSLPEATDALQNKFPHLLIALATQIYFVLGTGKRDSRKQSISTEVVLHPSPLSTTLQALKNLIACAGYIREFNMLGMQGCWEMLVTPENYFEGIFQMVRTLFLFTKLHLKMTFKQANVYLRRSDPKERMVGMAFFAELLCFSEIGFFFVKQDILDVLQEWMGQDNVLMQLFSFRGLRNMVHHQPLQDEFVEPLFPPLINAAVAADETIAKESIKTLHAMFQHLDMEEYESMWTVLIPHLSKFFYDDEIEVQHASIFVFGILLQWVKDSNRNMVTDNVLRSLVPLLIHLADSGTREVSKNTLWSCACFMKWTNLPQDIFSYEAQESLYVTYLNISKSILWTYKHNFPEMLSQMVQCLKSKNATYREAAAILIASNAQYMKTNAVRTEQVEDVFLALQELQGDCDAAVTNAAVESIEEVFRQCGHRINPQIVPNQLMIMLRNSMGKQPFVTSKH